MPRKKRPHYSILSPQFGQLYWCKPERQWLTFDAPRVRRKDGSNSSADWRIVKTSRRTFAIAQTLANQTGKAVEVTQKLRDSLEKVWIVEPKQ